MVRDVSRARVAATIDEMNHPPVASTPHRESPITGPTVTFPVHFRTGASGRRRLWAGARPSPPPAEARVPRIAKTMALAIRFDRLIRDGAARDYADLARLIGVSRARVSQIMDLLNLAPELQERLLVAKLGTDSVTVRQLRSAVAEVDWERQLLHFSSALTCKECQRDP